MTRFTSDQNFRHDRTPNLKSVWLQRNRETLRRRESLKRDLAQMLAEPTIRNVYHHLTGRWPKGEHTARNYLMCQWGTVGGETRKGIIDRMFRACGLIR